jgi:hypothetical protein
MQAIRVQSSKESEKNWDGFRPGQWSEQAVREQRLENWVSQRGSARELEELRIQREDFRERLLEITRRQRDVEDHTSCLVVTAI